MMNKKICSEDVQKIFTKNENVDKKKKNNNTESNQQLSGQKHFACDRSNRPKIMLKLF